jgi:hypothetical protein
VRIPTAEIGREYAHVVLALTVRQPWATLIVRGRKDVENRSWRPPRRIIGQRIAVHAAARRVDLHDLDGDALLAVRGAIIGTVVVIDCVDDSPSPWAMDDCYHWLLANPVLLAEPLVCAGARGVWKVPFGPTRIMRLNAEAGRLGQ